jgi:hypothetical protein
VGTDSRDYRTPHSFIRDSLADNPAYEALYYVWGDPAVTEDIHIITPPRAALEIQSTEAQKAAQGLPIELIMLKHHKGRPLSL